MSKLKIFAAALAAAVSVGAGAQAAVLDQSSAPFGGSFYEALNWQQAVTAGLDGQLTGITLYGNGTNVTVRVAEGDGFHSGPFAFSQFASLAMGGTFIDVSSANIFLNAGERFVIDLTGGYGGNISAAASTYGGGSLFLNFGVPFDYTACCNASLAFQTFMEPTSPGGGVPEPTTWALMLIGFGGLGATLRRRRTAALAA